MFDTHPRTPTICLTAALLWSAYGCADDATCSEGQVVMGGNCVDANDGASGDGNGAQGDAGNGSDPDGDQNGDAVADAGAGRPAAEEGFGDACTDDVDHSECTDTADFCAIMPGASEGICTAHGCADDATVCPEGWGCLDLSVFMEGLPSICTEP